MQETVATSFRPRPYSIRSDLDAEGSQAFYRVVPGDRKARDLTTTYGDMLCNLRASLDCLASQVTKQPYYLHPSGDPDGILAFAGLYDTWRDPSKADDDPDRWLWSCTIVTADASGPAGEIHDRTPLILPPDRIDAWLDPTRTDPDAVYEVLDGIVMPPLDVRPVSTRVNRVGPHGPDLIEPLDGHDEPLQLTLATRAA